MSSSNKNVPLKNKPPLPVGWVACRSKSYPDRMYYYNVVTGCSSWDEPKYPKSDNEQRGKKLTDLLPKSDTSSVKMASHKPCEVTLTSALDNRLRSNTSYSRVLSHNSHRMTLAQSKKYERCRMEHDPTFPCVKDFKKINSKMNINEKISAGNEKSTFDGAECKDHKSRGTCKEEVCRKRRMKQKSSRSVEAIVGLAVERPPSGQIKLHHDGGCQYSNDSIKEVLPNKKKNNQIVLPSTSRASSSSSSYSSEVHLQKDDTQHIPKARRQNKISLEHAVVNTTKRKCDLQDCDSGLAARRLKALQTKLAEELVNKGTSGGQESEEPLRKIRKFANPSRSTAGCSEIGVPVRSLQTSRKESSLLKNDCSTVTDSRNLEMAVPDPCQRTYLKRDSEKCNAAKRLESLRKKLTLDCDRDCKEPSVQKGNSPVKTYYGPESCARGDRSPSAYVSTYGSNIRNKESFQRNMKQSSEKCPDLTGHMTIDEDELMEWEPIEDDKILSHIQEVRIQIQHDDKSIQKLDYGTSPIFSASGQQEWFIVLDSNVLISNVKYVEELRDTNVKGLGFPVLVIPWQVLQELDVLKDQGRVKSNLLAARARRAISFLHSNFTSQHTRVRGQTAMDAISKDFKIEVPDDAILHCCLQIAQKTNQVILLSNDKNLCNKAIVNGIRAYKMAEIQQALQELGTECSSGNVLMAVMPVNKAVPVVDSVQCRLKLLLKELLSRVVENEMIKVYDTSWKRIVVIKPPWTLSDILICMRKHWIGVFGFVMPAEAKPILECLSGFFGNITQSKGCGHSLSDVKAVLQQSLRLCMLIRSEDYLELVSRCVTDIELLQKHCEETGSALTKKSEEEKSLVKNETQHGDIQSVIDVLKECWNSVHFFCAVMCDVLGIEHHMVYNRPQIFPTPDTIREKLPYYCHSIHALIRNIIRIRELPMSVLTVDHEAVNNFFLILTNFLPSKEGEEKINPELILKFCTTESTRSMLEAAQVMFQEIGVILDRGMNYFVQCGT